jgi:hypothetical protein
MGYEVIQTLSPGHSGARNDKHIGSAGTVSINGYCSDIEEDMEDMSSNCAATTTKAEVQASHKL